MYRDRYIKSVRIFGLDSEYHYTFITYIYHYEMTRADAGLTVGKYFTILTISELQNSFLNQGQTVTGPGGC